MRIVVGIDGGGTKTEAVAMDLQGQVQLRVTGESTNPHAVTFPGALRNLSALLDDLRHSPALNGAEWRSMALGLSGISTAEEQDAVLRHLRQYQAEHGLVFATALQNDAQIALMATLRREEGIIAISGTGSIVFGLTPGGPSYRAGGWGHILGDEGSGYDLGLRTLKAVARRYDGIGPATRLTDMVLERYRLSGIGDLRAYVYKDSFHKSDIAKFAEIAVKAADEGDLTATGLIAGCARDLAAAALAVIGKNPWFTSCDLVTTGSIFGYSRLYAETFREVIEAAYPEIKLHASRQSPAYGAALLALKHLEIPIPTLTSSSTKESD